MLTLLHLSPPRPQLSTNEQRAVGGLFRRDQMGSEGYKDMSKTEYSGKEERESAKQDE